MSGFDQLVLNTRRLRLRPFVEADAGALFTIFPDPPVTRYLSTPPWSLISTATERIQRDLRATALCGLLRSDWQARPQYLADRS